MDLEVTMATMVTMEHTMVITSLQCLAIKYIIQNLLLPLEAMEHLWRPSAHRVAREHLKCQPPTEEKAAGASQSRKDSANPLSARVHLVLRDHLARMEFQEGMETRELQEHLEEEDLQDHLVPMALQEHQASMGKTAFLELLGLLEPQARMVQEEFLGNRECQDPKDLREHQARVVGLVRRVLRVHQVLLDNLESLERMEETAHLVLQALQAWMEPLDHKVQWVHQVSKESKERQEQQDLEA